MEILERVRFSFARQMRLSSAYRCPDYNNSQSSSGGAGPHTTARAVDVLMYGADAHKLLGIALDEGMSGIGLSQRGSYGGRFVHLDNLTDPPRPWVWTY